MFSFSQANKLALARALSVAGRSSRSEYWWCSLSYFLVVMAINIVIGIFLAISDTLGFIVGIVGNLALLACFVVMLLLFVRRLHDRDMSGWWVLLGLIPLIGGIALFVFSVLPGKPGPNRFGINPVEDKDGHFNFYVSGQYKTMGAYGAVNPMFAQNPFGQQFNQQFNQQANQNQAQQPQEPQQPQNPQNP